MSKTIEMPLDLAKRIAGDSYQDSLRAVGELRELLVSSCYDVCSKGVLCQDQSCAECGGNGSTSIAAPVVDRQAEPVAWMRKWAADGITPAKVKNENGRMAWPFKFKLVPVSEAKCLPDDVALYSFPPGHELARLDKPAMVGCTRFSAGVSSRLVVEAAQRHHEYEVIPEKEALRIERGSELLAKLHGDASPTAPVAVALPDPLEDPGMIAGLSSRFAQGWNACLDKIKEMNQ